MVDGGVVRLGLIACGELPERLAGQLVDDLPRALAERACSDLAWEVPRVTDALAADRRSDGTEMVDAARRRMLREGWDLAVCLTDVPLRIGRRPIVADASATHGVAVLSLPALGAVQLRRRACDAVVRLVDGLMSESLELGQPSEDRRWRVGRRLGELAASTRTVRPRDPDVDVRFVAAVVRGNLRLLSGMLRANRPWRLAARLSRALAAALAAVAFALVTSDIWRLADALAPLRLAVLGIASVALTVVALIVAHGLWERSAQDRARERIVLFNVATALTLALGVAALYAALFGLTLLGAALMLDSAVLDRAVGHDVGLGDYAELAWMIASLATVGGALGSALESDAAVREAAYGYRPERLIEHESGAG
jgi:hypothetical protein